MTSSPRPDRRRGGDAAREHVEHNGDPLVAEAEELLAEDTRTRDVACLTVAHRNEAEHHLAGDLPRRGVEVAVHGLRPADERPGGTAEIGVVVRLDQVAAAPFEELGQ